MDGDFDFTGWATRNNVKCADGRTILKDAFIHNDGQVVPLVWNHQHGDVANVLGHALLENREEGVYAYCTFNDTEKGKDAKLLVQHGDVTALSIFANNLKEKANAVFHGAIREVSLVLAGANPGAFIDTVIAHGDDPEAGLSAWIFTDEEINLCHSDDEKPEEDAKDEGSSNETEEKSKEDSEPEKEETVEDIVESMNEKQKNVMYAMVNQAAQQGVSEEKPDEEKESENKNSEESEGGDKTMKHNVFDAETQQGTEAILSHDAIGVIMKDAKRMGSLRESVLAHADAYGIENIDILFPDARTLTNQPEFIKRKTEWVADVIDGAHHSPFSRIKSVFADITADEARAKGYIKGNRKKEEVFSLLKRTTEPTTVYKKQKLDRDDIVDITDFDVVSYVKGEMRIMLDEELARAALIGDGRLASSDDKIPEDHIRPIWTDDELYAIHVETTPDDAEAFIDSVITAMADYEGSGAPKLFAPQSIVTACLLLKDTNKHRLYKTMAELATALQVSKIVPVPVMKNQSREADGSTWVLDGIIVNMNDYNFGADKGGAVNMFDDFDIDYNQQKYLMETRCSGALTKPKSAIVLEHKKSA